MDVRIVVTREETTAKHEWWWTAAAEARITYPSGELVFRSSASRGDVRWAIDRAKADVVAMSRAYEDGQA